MRSITIYDWMVSKCKLSGNELLLFAFLYDSYVYSGGLSIFTIIDRLSGIMSRATIYRCLDSLVNMNLVKKVENMKCTFYSYSFMVTNYLDRVNDELEDVIKIAKTPWVKNKKCG